MYSFYQFTTARAKVIKAKEKEEEAKAKRREKDQECKTGFSVLIF